MKGVKLRHLVFTGTNIEASELIFEEGLNIVYGASNTGKSFASNAILFMLGVIKKLPEIDEIAGYDSVWLALTLSNNRDVTLYRKKSGGAFKLYEGIHKDIPLESGTTLRPTHDAKRTDTISHLLLDAIGVAGSEIVRDGNCAKASLSIRLLSPYMVVSEENIIAARSPVFTSGSPIERTFEQNLFKFLLTGIDGSSAITVQKPSEQKVAKAAKIELVDELIAQIDAELGKHIPDENEKKEQLQLLDKSASNLILDLQQSQDNLDKLINARREKIEQHGILTAQATELQLTIERFNKLQTVYNSDLQRLQSIEEGGYVLIAMSNMDCPVCGAPSEAQKHNHAAEEIATAHKAATAEAKKIEREQHELTQTISSLETEAITLRQLIDSKHEDILNFNKKIEELRPHEASLRTSYETYISKQTELTITLELLRDRSKLLIRRQEIEQTTSARPKEDKPTVGPDSKTLFKFGETLRSVLMAWHFPDAEKVQFDSQIMDISIAGKPRSANGKGVRAVLHAAFNVAVVVFCIENKRPYPGFLVLDTPLLTYREPLTSRHGDLSADEQALKKTQLAEHFYTYLADLKDKVQFIVLENSDPPTSLQARAHIEIFTGFETNGRFGLLPPKKEPTSDGNHTL